MPVYRYKLIGIDTKRIQSSVAGAITVGSLSPAVYVDITAGSGDKNDLDEVMTADGYTFDSQDPTSTPAQAAVSTNTTQAKQSARAATTAALPSCTYANGTAGVGATLTATANGALAAQDGVTLIAGDRFLVKNQAAGLQNGIYSLTQVGTAGTPFILTRATDTDAATDITATVTVFVEEGTANSDTGWTLTTNNPITVGTTALSFSKFTSSAAGSSFNIGTAVLDFGAFPGKSDASVAVTGQTGILSGSVVSAWLYPVATADHTADEHLVEPIGVTAGNISAGVGFTIYGFNVNQLTETIKTVYQGQAVGGTGTLIYGQWTVAWSWA